ncbi:MAG: hypothetical protein Q9165_006533 [Trypethelium subeluteriae]
MDSRAIAAEIEKRYPTPALPIFSSPAQEKLGETITAAMQQSLAPELISRVPRTLLNPVSREYFERTRKERFGMPLEEVEKEKGGRKAWDAAHSKLEEAAAMLKEKGGPFLDGQQVSFADFLVVGYLRFIQILNQPLYNHLIQTYPEFGTLFEASKQWLERDDH